MTRTIVLALRDLAAIATIILATFLVAAALSVALFFFVLEILARMLW